MRKEKTQLFKMNQVVIELINKYRPIKLNAPATHFLKFLCQPAFGTFAKPDMPTHNQGFEKEPNFCPQIKQDNNIKRI